MKTHRIASLVLAGVMAVSSLTGIAAKKDAFTPNAAMDRLDNEFNAVVDMVYTAFENSDMSEQDAYELLDWVYLLASVYETALTPLEDAAYADEYRNESESYSRDGSEYEFKTTASLEQFTVTEKETESDGAVWTYKVSFMRKLNRMAADYVMTIDEKDVISTALDYVVGEERIYIQLAAFDSYDKDTGDAIYDVVRVMVAEGQVCASLTVLDAKELKDNRVTSVYPNFAAFAFTDGEVFVFDGMNVTIGDVRKLDKAKTINLTASPAAA